jgi:hypothetical protein
MGHSNATLAHQAITHCLTNYSEPTGRRLSLQSNPNDMTLDQETLSPEDRQQLADEEQMVLEAAAQDEGQQEDLFFKTLDV